MTRAIIHRTPGLLDPRAFTVMGLSAKPGTDTPIGMFGTGLKYAIAVLCRHGCSPVIYVGTDRYTFRGKADKFRGSEFVQITARLDRLGKSPKYLTLPFTTEYGKFWQVWQAFRELESNTLDEGGQTFCVELYGGAHTGSPTPTHYHHNDGEAGHHLGGREGETMIVVDLPEYVHAWTFRDETFLPDAVRRFVVGVPVVAHEGETDKLYWRGLRVLDMPNKKTVRTWNFLAQLELTEDRTLKHEGIARGYLARWLAQHCTDARVIEDVLRAEVGYWEHRLDFETWAGEPSALFRDVARRVQPVGVQRYLAKYEPPSVGATPWDRHPTPWRVEEGVVYDANGLAIFNRPYEPPIGWDALASAMVGRVNAGLQRSPAGGISTAP